eukprot:5448970-Pleurochrysis_carterae.AAC.1
MGPPGRLGGWTRCNPPYPDARRTVPVARLRPLRPRLAILESHPRSGDGKWVRRNRGPPRPLASPSCARLRQCTLSLWCT